VEFSKINHAINFLSIARTKTTHQTKHDQVDFWLYLLTDYKGFLEPITKSTQVSLYSLRANDILKTPYPKVITPVFENKTIKDFNITNPIDWEKIKLKIKENPNRINTLAENYKSAETLGIYTYLKEKASKYTVPYYPLPYFDAMNGFTKERQAILYAIARQESRFVPASVSPSYAMGMMQIMPFLIKHLAKERKEKLDYSEMFNPYIAISYANQHMDYLNKWLYHPLFVAYAYNGGIGFTRKTIRKKHLFKKGKYEPYLSMELIDYEESKEYGKKVLTNYVVYLNLLGTQTKVSSFLNTLAYPSQTDCFRK
jgi:soluble lytic murein transglycosylase